MKVTSQDVTVNFRDYGPITIPAGTRTTHHTAMGEDPNYNFVDEYGWIKNNYPDIANILHHDVYYHGIDIPKEYIIEKP